jgi:hypothetical protein
VVVVVALVAGGIVFLGGEEAAASEVILEPAAANGSDPFFDSIATSEVEVAGGGLEEVAGSQGAVESLGGDTPGLYGGTGEDAVCDPDALVAFLEENKAKAKAFAEPLGIAPRAVSDYVAGLTPVVLREDTRVTNHGFKDGRATPVQSVLQAGTAVLVDDLGVPRVRCACGNPLAEPTAIEGTLAYSGDSWDGFDDARLVAVAPASESQEEFEVIDVTTGEPYTAPAGSGGGLTLDQLLNVEVPFWCGTGDTDPELVRLVDGVYECPNPPSKGAAGGPNYQIWVVGRAPFGDTGVPKAAVGDLTGDGFDEGVILTMYHGGQAGAGPTLPMVFSSEEEYLLTGPNDLPGPPNDVRILDGGIIEFQGVEFGECTACAPGPPYTARYRLAGNELRAVE